MKKYILTFILLLGALALHAQQEGIAPGKVRLKLTERAAKQLQQAARPLTAATGTLSVGIAPLDAMHARYRAVKMHNVFTIGGPFEARQRRYGLHLWYDVTVDHNVDIDRAVSDYLSTGNVETATPVYKTRPLATPDDPYYNRQWHYYNTGQNASNAVAGFDIRLPEAWELTQGDPKVIVAVVDGGIDYTHPDLAANMWPGTGRSFVTGTPDVEASSHGTHVAGTIAAAANNGVGVAGIAGGWGAHKGAQLMSCQIYIDSDDKAENNTADAIRFGADNGAVISQNSWGYIKAGAGDPAVRAAINYFITYAGKDNDGNPLPGTPMAGGIVIFAAGNDNSNRNDWYPAAWPEVLSVAAMGPTGKRAHYSNYNSEVDIIAPGGDQQIKNPQGGVYSTVPGGYNWLQGTSMACPHVSGIAALVLSRLGSSTFTPDMLRRRLILSARPLTGEPEYVNGNMGAGLIDAYRAVLDSATVTGITLPVDTTLYYGRSAALSPVIEPATATDQRVSWSTANADIATVDHTGRIIINDVGTTTITVQTTDGGHEASTTITVIPVPVESVTVSPREIVVKPGETALLSASVLPDDAFDKTIRWISRNPDIAAVNSTGVVLASSSNTGEAYIVAESNDGSIEDSCIVTVVRPVTGVTVSPVNIRLLAGDIRTLNTTVFPADAYDRSVSWSSSNSGIVSVDAAGKLQARKAGRAQVTVRTNDGGYTAVCTVEVYDAVQAPQAFSPNGDGINDYFELVLDSRDTYVLQVFDRSGQVYYRSDNYLNDWDGTANTGKYAGNKVPAGTYFYQLAGNSSGNKSGYVVIKY